MSNNHDRDIDLQLDRHLDALRSESVPDGPSPQVMRATMELLKGDRAAEGSAEVIGRRSIFERLVGMTLTQRIAAVVTITLGAIVLYVAFTLFSTMGSSIAYADVAAKLKEGHTLVYTTTMTLPGTPAPVQMKVMSTDALRTRMEMADGSAVIHSGNTTLILHPKTYKAERMELTAMPARPSWKAPSMMESLRGLADAKGERVGEKVIDGVAVVGFRSSYAGYPAIVWADKKTADPVRIELSGQYSGGQEISTVIDHFQVDVPLDDSLFSTDPPAGYTMTTQTLELPKFGALEDDMASLLRGYAEKTGGSFPASLTDWSAFIKAYGGEKGDDPDLKQVMTRVGAASGRLFSLSGGYGYAGKDAKLGEKEKVIFWYKPDAKAARYRVVYGDLRVGDAAGDSVPYTLPTTRPAGH